MFTKEIDFEKALTIELTKHGWEPNILKNPTEEDLVKNLAFILYNNNRERDRLSDYPLTDSEMQQVITQVDSCSTPYEKSKLINGGLVCIRRDNPQDLQNCGKEVYLKIFDPKEIKAGQSIYQIARQPRFKSRHPLSGQRRGDVMLLINGMPVFHIELKRSGVDVTQAVNQIKRYVHGGVFEHGIFSLVQVFVAMTPEKTRYFANPGAEENFSPSFYFHWADYNNAEETSWRDITTNLLSIPMAHQMIGYYTIADDKDKTLKVLRSYQYFAASKICDRVHEINWDEHNHGQKGGFIWHTTGSGKTMTSFKAAQLIANSGDADKVVFLLDRVELSVQSLDEYRGFAGETDSIQDTDNTSDLQSKLESDDPKDTLIVTSLQKMSRINTDNNVTQACIERIGAKRVVFIVDECHRDVFGAMLMTIKNTFPRAVLFGFTGTPIFEDNAHGELTTGVIFGDMLHKYTLGSGIPDGNVLGFDMYKEELEEHYVREAVALNKAGVESREQIGDDKEKQDIYKKWMYEVDIKVVEKEIQSYFYSEEHHLQVAAKIVEERPQLSRNGKFHAILATKNIPEAIAYYEIFKENYPEYNVVSVFDDSIDNVEKAGYKEDAILRMLTDYNSKYGTQFQQSTYAKYKKDVAKRLAHKVPYTNIEKDHDKQIDLLIVVTQMLTGYDSKWVNTLYVDKLMKGVDVIQAFSRTNRLFNGPGKPFGIIKYFDRPNIMEEYVNKAMELYMDQPMSTFVDKLEANLEKINKAFKVIETLFSAESIENFCRLPKAPASRNKFASEFCEMTKHLEAAKMQGFMWDKLEYEFEHNGYWTTLVMAFTEEIYNVLLQRYRELFDRTGGDGGEDDDDVYTIEAYLTEKGAGTIDAEYINSKFIKFVKVLYTHGTGSQLAQEALENLHRAFASLSQRDQRTATIILHDIQSGDLRLTTGKTIQDYILDYQKKECDKQILVLSEALGLSREKLTDIIEKGATEQNLNEFGRFDALTATINVEKAKVFLKKISGKEPKGMFVKSEIISILRRFILVPEDRSKIIFAYQNTSAILDENIPDEIPEDEPEQPEQETPAQSGASDNNKRTKQETISALRLLVKNDLRRIDNMPLSEKVINTMFEIFTYPSLEKLDGVGINLFKAIDETMGRHEVNFVDKHAALSQLCVNFEIYLKKLYYLVNGFELRPVDTKPKYDSEGNLLPAKMNATLIDAILQMSFLRDLRSDRRENYQRLYGYLRMLQNSRNTDDGTGAHFSHTMTEEEMDKLLKAFLTMYVYVTGMCYDDLVNKHSELAI